MIHLREISITTSKGDIHKYPFNIKAIQHLSSLEFKSPVTILIGENGSGKSTLLEAMANAIGTVVIGREEISSKEMFSAISPLSENIKLTWNKRTHRGFFLRAEDFFSFVQRIRSLQNEMFDELNRIEWDYSHRSTYSKSLAAGPIKSSIQGINHRYGDDLDANSHGESFLKVFQSRFAPDGLYLLDEPEAALSPLRQLGLISLIKQMITQDAQFILATHSPIMMAIPQALILDLDQKPPAYNNFDEIEQVVLYREFLRNPAVFLRHL